MKNIIVTGGSRGIGQGIARELAKRGHHVIITYNKTKQGADRLCSEFENICAIKCDVTNSEECKYLIETSKKQFGKIDVLVNNAGIADQKMFCDISENDWDEMFDTNVKSVYRLSKYVLPYMIHEKDGAIINISSIWGMVGASCEVHYSASKAAIIGFTKALAKEVGPSGVRVNTVAPGVIETDMLAGFDEETRQSLAYETPLGRTGTPKDIAKAVIYLVEDSFVTGQVISPNGGFVIV